MNKLYIWTNDKEASDFVSRAHETGVMSHPSTSFFGPLPGGLVVLANNIVEAKELAEHMVRIPADLEPVVIDPNKKGVVMYVDGNDQ